MSYYLTLREEGDLCIFCKQMHIQYHGLLLFSWIYLCFSFFLCNYYTVLTGPWNKAWHH